ncbi:MAG: amidohydrolase [Eubacteriales bacterium]|nr:amidohydrolase [Eubacteriales bacterium]
MIFEKIGIIDSEFEFQSDMYVVTQADRIVYVGKEKPSEEVYRSAGPVYEGKRKVLLPGFVNAHGHSPMCLMRGYGENLPLDAWLNTRIFPFEAKLYRKGVYWSTLLTMAESMRFGIVSTSDMYMLCDDMIRSISESGMKSNICHSVTNIDGKRPEENPSLKNMRDLILMYDGFENGRIITDACLHAEYTNDEDTIRAVADVAKEFDVRTQVHVAETSAETEGCQQRHQNRTPVQYLADMGIFDVPVTAAHCVWLNDEDRTILRDKKATVAANVISNLKLNSGICDIPQLQKAGVSVAIGTDSVASNNSLDFFEEMKTFALLAKIKGGNDTIIRPEDVLYSATRAGALAQGREDCGLVQEGFKADLVVVDLDVPNMQPIHDVRNNLVYSASGKDILLTMVDGKVLYKDGEYCTLDIEKIMAETDAARKKILSEL